MTFLDVKWLIDSCTFLAHRPQINKEDFEDCLDDIGKSLNELQSQQSSLDRLFDRELKRLLDELRKKMTLDDFDKFKKGVDEGKERS